MSNDTDVGAMRAIAKDVILCYNSWYVSFYRHGLSTTRHEPTDNSAKLIPFSFVIKLPPPRLKRVIVRRNEIGRIVHSITPKIAL